jgi:non-ribosomal peptide synthetase component F
MDRDHQPQAPLPAGGPETLERLLAWHARRTPDKLALIDPANRDILQHPGAAPNQRSYDFASLEAAVGRLAARLGTLGLEPGDYVAVQLPNLSEAYIVLLALLRARLVPCLMPLNWGGAEIDRAFERLKPAAILCCGRFEGRDLSMELRDAACRHMSIRYLGGVGHRLAEGVDDLGPLIDSDDAAPAAAATAAAGLNELALVTFVDPVTCVPHSHGQLLANGLLQVMEIGISAQDRLLGAYAPSSPVGLNALACPWLVTGATLTLHHPLDRGLLQRQLSAGEISYFAGPDALVSLLLKDGRARPEKLAFVWRHGHLPSRAAAATGSSGLFDLWSLGDIGVVPARRSGAQAAGLFAHGRICLPADGERELCLAAGEIVDGTLRIRGRIFPSPALIGSGLEWFSLARRVKDDAIDTGIAAFAGPGGSLLIGDRTPQDEAHEAAE